MDIKKVGFLVPQRKRQDTVLVYGGGISPTIRARDYKGSIKIIEVNNGEKKNAYKKQLRGAMGHSIILTDGLVLTTVFQVCVQQLIAVFGNIIPC